MRLAGFPAASQQHPALRTAGLRTALLATLALIAVLACVLFAHAGTDGQDVNVPAAVSPMTMSATGSASAAATTAGAVHSGTVLSGTVAQAVALSASVAVSAAAAATGMARTIAASVGQRVLCFEGNSLGGGAMTAMSCSILLVLGSLLLIAGGPSALGLLFVAGGFVVGTFRTIAPHLHRPNLTQLSVSRI